MSSSGGDPIDALLAQQAQGQGQPVFGDPVDGLLIQQAQGVPPPASSQPQAPSPADGSWADPSGYLSSVVRNLTNGASYNLADPIAAATGAAIPIPGWTEPKNPGPESATYGQRFGALLKMSRDETAQGQKAHPGASLAASVAGGVINPLTLAMGAPATIGKAILQGAATGAAYGAGGSIGNAQTLQDAGEQTLGGAGLGAAGAGVAQGLGRILSGATRSRAAQLLANEGINLTPGQSLGGTAHTLEDASTHIPMLGNAIKARQADSITDFNRAAYNRTLAPLGLQYGYPATAPVGNAGIKQVGDVIGSAYDKAYQGATIQQGPNFSKAISQTILDALDALPKDRVDIINKNINGRLIGKFDQNGNLPADDLIRAKNWFAEQSRVGPTASQDEKAIGNAYGSVVDAIKDGIGETDPDKGALLNAADTAYMHYVKLGQAAGQNAASGRGGVFTPAQLGNALRSTDQSTRRMNFAKGLAPMQDLAQAGQAVLPSTVPDSGTALRGLLELGAGGAITHEISPEAAIGGAGLIGAGTALYSRPGQKLAQALLFGASGARKAMGAIPKAALPGLLAASSASGGSGKP